MTELYESTKASIEQIIANGDDTYHQITRRARIDINQIPVDILQTKDLDKDDVQKLRQLGMRAIATPAWFEDVQFKALPYEYSPNTLHLEVGFPLASIPELPSGYQTQGNNMLFAYDSSSAYGNPGDPDENLDWVYNFIDPATRIVQRVHSKDSSAADIQHQANEFYQSYLTMLGEAAPNLERYATWGINYYRSTERRQQHEIRHDGLLLEDVTVTEHFTTNDRIPEADTVTLRLLNERSRNKATLYDVTMYEDKDTEVYFPISGRRVPQRVRQGILESAMKLLDQAAITIH